MKSQVPSVRCLWKTRDHFSVGICGKTTWESIIWQGSCCMQYQVSRYSYQIREAIGLGIVSPALPLWIDLRILQHMQIGSFQDVRKWILTPRLSEYTLTDWLLSPVWISWQERWFFAFWRGLPVNVWISSQSRFGLIWYHGRRTWQLCVHILLKISPKSY